MKKSAKKLVALVAAATITLGCSATAFATNSVSTTTTGLPAGNVPTTSSVTQSEVAAPLASTVAPNASYPEVKYTEKTFRDDTGVVLGTYPEIEGMDVLNKEIFDTIWKQHNTFYMNNPSISLGSHFACSFEAEQNERFAVFVVTLTYPIKSDTFTPVEEKYTYIIDKSSKTQVTEDYYKAVMADVEAATAAAETAAETAAEEQTTPSTAEAADEAANEDEAAEMPMVPIREFAEYLGYSLEWVAEEKAVIVLIDEDEFTTVYVDINAYIIDGAEAELESAPINEDGTVYVPLSFFEKVMGAKVVYNADGSFELAATE